MAHAKAHSRAVKPLALAFAVTFVIFLLELIGGLWTGSLALIADATHMAVDLAALGLGLFAAWIADRPADEKRTFGYHRVEVLAALANGIALWIAVGVILHEAWGRFREPGEIKAAYMLAIAVVGLAANLLSAGLLFKHSHDNMNVRGVLLHVLSDALGSVGAIIAALAVWTGGYLSADPLASVFICVVISFASYKLVRDSTHILLEGAPGHVDLAALRSSLAGIEGVLDVHDLHIWSLCSEKVSMSGHLVIGGETVEQAVRKAAARVLREAFGIGHVTLQVERREAKKIR